jgi:hypothetical protein
MSVRTKKATPKRKKPTLLSGGNPQIPKGEGDAPVQAYIAAIPGWKRNVARRVDELVVRTVPRVRKAVKWNSPFYGAGDEGWFLSFHWDIYEDRPLDEAQFTGWIEQASRLPGERL